MGPLSVLAVEQDGHGTVKHRQRGQQRGRGANFAAGRGDLLDIEGVALGRRGDPLSDRKIEAAQELGDDRLGILGREWFQDHLLPLVSSSPFLPRLEELVARRGQQQDRRALDAIRQMVEEL